MFSNKHETLLRLIAAITPFLLSACATAPAENEVPAIAAAAKQPLTKGSDLVLYLPQTNAIEFRGAVNFDQAGVRPYSVLYPAPHIAVGIAALITHGIINESAKSSQRTKIQEQADQVLRPYKGILSGFHHPLLADRAWQWMSTSTKMTMGVLPVKKDTRWSLVSAPVFFLTQDQRAIILENTVAILEPGNDQTPVYQKTVKVVSQPLALDDIEGYWMGDQGKNLVEISARLFAESIELAIEDHVTSTVTNAAIQRTFRYPEGQSERMERGQLVRQDCNRIVLKTLRDEPMSIPVVHHDAQAPGAQACAQGDGGPHRIF